MTGVLESERVADQDKDVVDARLLRTLRDVVARGHAMPAELVFLREVACGSFVEQGEVARRALGWSEDAKRRPVLPGRKKPASTAK